VASASRIGNKKEKASCCGQDKPNRKRTGMNCEFLCGKQILNLRVPDDAIIYESSFPKPPCGAAALVARALQAPIGCDLFQSLVRQRRPGPVAVVVSDITRPIQYAQFLHVLLNEITAAGVARDEIHILVANGMHRPLTAAEHIELLGSEIARSFVVFDHDASDARALVPLAGRSWSGASVSLNRRYMEAGFRIVTGLVEPHFMAGFSGGRKALCPGLADLQTLRNFHGYSFIANPASCNGNLDGNPLHCESLSICRLAGVDFSLNVVQDKNRRVAAAFAGEIEQSHLAACDFARSCFCPEVKTHAGAAVTSCGGYPLDATFYQCVKGFVSPLPAVRSGGALIAFGGCAEGVGSSEYERLMRRYAGSWEKFEREIATGDMFTKDQWQFQMHVRALRHTGIQNVHFYTSGLGVDTLQALSITGHAVEPDQIERRLQQHIDTLATSGQRLAVFPEGPYCAPVAGAESR
jgi:nickel-dependent lactate racemase